MKIYVNNRRSVTLCALEVESNTTVECVQNKIQEKLEIPSEQQRLFFTDKVLDVEKTLGGYKICNGSCKICKIYKTGIHIVYYR